MPTNPTTDVAPTTNRRSFLTKTAVGGALVTAAAVAAPLAPWSSLAGAQDDPTAADVVAEAITDAVYVAFLAPLELAAVQIYQEAIDAELLDEDWLSNARMFQTHHQQVATLLATLAAEESDPLVASPDFQETGIASVTAAGDQNGVLSALEAVEQALSATHLSALELLSDATTARNAAQVLTIEAQQGVVLGMGAGTSVDELTPEIATTDAALPLTSQS